VADIQGIYNRLNSGSQYTPLSAETFGDWSMEAGDLVTVVKDGRSYVTPIMQGDLKWDGASKVTIESVGNREREPLGRMSRRKYSGGGGGYWNSKKAFTKIAQSDTEINLIAKEQRNIGGKVTTLESNFSVMSDRIGGSIDADGKIIAEAAIEAVTGPDGKTLLGIFRVNADHIYLNGNTTLSGAMEIVNGNLRVNSGIAAEHFYLGTGFIPVMMDYGVYDLKITQSGNTYTLQKQTYADAEWQDVGNFSRAVASATWAWSNGRAKVDLSPQGQSYYSPSIDSWTVRGNPSVNGSTVSQDINIVDEDGNTVTILNVSVNASAVENPISIPTNYIYTTPGLAPSGSTNATTMRTRILQAIADSETLVFRVDCGGSKKYYHMNF